MKPLMLQGHERAITQIKYNREGDLIFSTAKDHKPSVWFSLNGERLGTYNGHQGAVWCVDVDWTTSRLITGSGDMSCKIWDVETGRVLGTIPTNSATRTANFSFSGNQASYSTDKAMGHNSELFIIDVRNVDASISNQSPVLKLTMNQQTKITSMLWGALDETVITGHENGSIRIWDLRTAKELNSVNDHTTAKLFDSESLMCLKTYKTERPVNSAAISPIHEHVVLGGGQEAMEVTTTSTKSGKFDSRLFHLVYEEEFARVKGHFGPINSLAFHPDGKSYATGGEDGFVRVQVFDPSYYEFVFE